MEYVKKVPVVKDFLQDRPIRLNTSVTNLATWRKE